jgi:hypothetical protein
MIIALDFTVKIGRRIAAGAAMWRRKSGRTLV